VISQIIKHTIEYSLFAQYQYYIMIYWLIPLIILFLIILPILDVHAVSREDINNMKDEINNAEKNIIQINQEIINQNKIIKEKQDQLEEEKDNLRQVKRDSNVSWDALLSIESAELAVRDAIQSIKDARNELFLLLNEKSDNIKLINLLDIQIIEDEKLLAQNQTNSSLVKLIGIELSQSCITLNQLNDTTSPCPTYFDMLYLDSSNTDISGKFITADGFFHRDKSPLHESWRWYDNTEKLYTILDPPHGMNDRIKMITLVPSLQTYTLNHDMVQHSKFELIDVMVNGTYSQKAISIQTQNQTQDYGRYLFHDRYIENCKNATISAKLWIDLLPITINHLRNDCVDSQFDEREIIYTIPSEIDITTSPNWQYTKWLNESKISCKGLCFEY